MTRAALLSGLLLAALAAGRGPADAQSAPEPDLRRTAFVTVRDATGDPAPGSRFGEDRGGFRAGFCDVEQTEPPLLSTLADPAPFLMPDDMLRVTAVEEIGRDALTERLRAAGGPPLLYTHGFYVDFDTSCRRASLLRESLGMEARFLLFSWPSDGALLNYARDEADLIWSVGPLERLVETLAEEFGPGGFDLAGHSLGARGVFLALQGMARGHPAGAPPLVGSVVLLAPDIDFGVFAQRLPEIRPLARDITVYVSDGDWPLALSRQLHGYARLGETGNDVGALEGVEVIDLSDLPTRSVSGHLYHVYNPEVGADMAALLDGGRRAAARDGLTQIGPNLWRLAPAE